MRESGILMHITSLPGAYGIGTMGKEAHRFVDFLKSAGQSLWQILPLTPTGYGDSPYQSCSTFAGNHYLIDLDTLIEQGLLKEEEVKSITWSYRDDKVDFGTQYNNRLTVLVLKWKIRPIPIQKSGWLTKICWLDHDKRKRTFQQWNTHRC